MRSISIKVVDGVIDAAVFAPLGAKRPWPAVIMFTDIGGLRPCFYEKAQTLADFGYAVLLPNLFYRSGSGQLVPEGKVFEDPDVLPVLIGYGAQLTPEALARDFSGMIHAIDHEPEFARGGIGAVGYCRGGGKTLRIAAQHPDRIVAAAGFHASRLAPLHDPDSPASIVGTIKARVYMGHADKDPYLPPDQISRLDSALAAAGVDFTTERYSGAMHGFTTKDSAAYTPVADALHFQRLSDLLEQTLK